MKPVVLGGEWVGPPSEWQSQSQGKEGAGDSSGFPKAVLLRGSMKKGQRPACLRGWVCRQPAPTVWRGKARAPTSYPV